MRPDWVEDEVLGNAPLRDSQVRRLLEMNKLLQDPANLEQIAMIKRAFADDEKLASLDYFEEFTQEEQGCLLVAPKYGGIFTTAERKLLMRR